MMFSRSNWPMRGLATNAGARLDLSFDEVVADLPIAPAAHLKHSYGDWPTRQQDYSLAVEQRGRTSGH
jgi:hypothetical protein